MISVSKQLEEEKAKPTRQRLTFEDFLGGMKYITQVYKTPCARVRVGFFLQYETGLRVSISLKFTSGNIRQLFAGNVILTEQIKGGSKGHNLCLGSLIENKERQL